VDKDNVIYVAQGGGGTTCTQASKCDTLAEGVLQLGMPNAMRKWILIEASVTPFDAGTVTIDDKVAIIKGAGATVRSNANSIPALIVSGTSNVTIIGLKLSAPQGATTPDDGSDAIRCTDAGSDVPTLVLRNVLLQSSEGQGLHAPTACNITIAGSTISSNAGGGITTNGGTITLTGSTISSNAGGGVSLTSSNFTIVNNFIVGNGNVSGTSRGVRIATIGGGATPVIFAFNTLVDNLNNSSPRTFSCTDVDKDVQLSSNLIWGLVMEDEVTTAASEPQCTHSNALIGPQPYAGGTNNVDIVLLGVTKASLFQSIVDPVNYHLKSGSAAINRGGSATLAQDRDFDGDDRPRGGMSDIGADEFE